MPEPLPIACRRVAPRVGRAQDGGDVCDAPALEPLNRGTSLLRQELGEIADECSEPPLHLERLATVLMDLGERERDDVLPARCPAHESDDALVVDDSTVFEPTVSELPSAARRSRRASTPQSWGR